MSPDEPRHKFIELSPLAGRQLKRKRYLRSFEQILYAELLTSERHKDGGCEGGFTVSFRKIRGDIPVRVTVCVEENDYKYYVRWLDDLKV